MASNESELSDKEVHPTSHNQTLTSNRSSFAEIKFVIKSIVPHVFVNKGVDSSFETSLEFKPILLNHNNNKICNKCDLSDYSDVQTKIDFKRQVSNSLETSPVKNDVTKKTKLNFDDNFDELSFRTNLTTSTPVKLNSLKVPIKMNQELKSSANHIKKYEYKLNLLTPPADATFIDSDFESMEQDRYSSGSSKESLSDERTLIKLMESSKEDSEETLKTCSPFSIRKKLQLQRRTNVKFTGNHKILEIFSSKKKKNRSLNSSIESESDRSFIPLTKANILKYTESSSPQKSKSQNWGENFEFSYICEPSSSDIEDDGIFSQSKICSLNISPDSSFEAPSIVLPIFKIDPPQSPPAMRIACEMVRKIVTNSLEIKSATTSILRRSLSDPATLKEPIYANSQQLTVSDFESDSEQILECAIQPELLMINCAAVKNLETLSVSCFNYFFVFYEENYIFFYE